MKGVAEVCFCLFLCLAVGIPFFNKEFTTFAPFPFFNAMCVNLLAIPISFAIASLTRGLPMLLSWISSQSKSGVYMALSGVFYGISCMMNMFCYSISDLDFIVVFSFIGIILEILMSAMFTGESIPTVVFTAIVIIASGLLSVVRDFEWSTEKYSISVQVLAQIVLHVSISLHSICNAKLAKTVNAYELPPPIVSFWVHLIAAVPTTIVFLFTEIQDLNIIIRSMNFNYGNLIVFGAVSHELYGICQCLLADFPGWGFTEHISKLKCLPILLISYKIYHATVYTFGQTLGIVLVILGYIFYSLNFERERYQRYTESDGDTIALLKNGLDDNVFMGVDDDE